MTNAFQYDSGLVYNIDVAYDAYAPTQSDNISDVALTHLATSFTKAIGPTGWTFSVVYQGTQDEIAQSVSMIVGTTIGERTVVPTFGIPQQPFAGPSASQIQTAVSTWENRCLTSVTVATDDDGNSQVRVAVFPR